MAICNWSSIVLLSSDPHCERTACGAHTIIFNQYGSKWKDPATENSNGLVDVKLKEEYFYGYIICGYFLITQAAMLVPSIVGRDGKQAQRVALL